MVQGKNEKNMLGKNVRVPRENWIIHPDKHPAIISKEVFIAAQNTLAESKKKYKRIGTAHEENIFKSKIFCSQCGRSICRDIHVNRQNGNRIYPTYSCRYCLPELKRANNIIGKGMALRLADPEYVVLNEITRQIDTCIELDDFINNASYATHTNTKRQALLSEQGRLIKETDKTDDLLTAAYTHHLNGVLNESEFTNARKKFSQDKQRMQVELAKTQAQLNEYDANRTRESEAMLLFRKYRGIQKLDREIINALIKRIELTPLSNELMIVFNFKDSFDSLAGWVTESEATRDAC